MTHSKGQTFKASLNHKDMLFIWQGNNQGGWTMDCTSTATKLRQWPESSIDSSSASSTCSLSRSARSSHTPPNRLRF